MICFKHLQNFNVDSFFPQNLFDIVILFVRNVATFESNAKFCYSTSYGLKQSMPISLPDGDTDWYEKELWLVSISKNQYRLFFKWQPVPKAQLCCFYWFTQNHADPCIRNSREESPLDLAAQYGKMETVWIVLLFINLWSRCPCFMFTSISSITQQ